MNESQARPWWTRPLFLCVITCAAVLMFFWRDLGAWDLWLHIKSGELILRDHVIHKTDPYSFRVLGRPWNNHQWLGSLLLYGMHSLAGVLGIIVLRCLLITGALMASWALARRREVEAGLAALLVLGAAFQLRVRALARPYLISFVMFMAVIWVLYDCILRRDAGDGRPPERQGPPRAFAAEDNYLWGSGGRLLLLLPLMWLWANLHAGYMMGLLLLGTFGVGELVRVVAQKGDTGAWTAIRTRPIGARFRAMLTVGAACLALVVVTPYGAETVLYPFRLTLTVDLLSRIAEWKPVKMSRTYALYWGVLGVGSLVILRSVVTRWLRGELRERAGVYATDLLLFAGFSFLPLRGVRHIAWILFLMPAILGHHMLVAPAGKDGRSLLRAVLAATAVAVAVLLGPVKFASRADHGVGLREDWYPVEACDFMEEAGLVDLRFYNSYEWGGYLIWRWGPEHKVFIDGRCLVYGDEMLEETFAVSDGESNWRDVLDRWKVQSIIMRYSAYDSKHFFQEPGWPCVHWDDTALVMLEPEELAARDLPGLELSNPVTFDWAGGPGDAEAAIDEIDVVLQRDPKCWTALAEKARCLVVLAEEGDRATRLERADVLARAAVRLSRRKHSAPWLATYYVALALGEEQRAEHARRRAEATRERWLSADEIRNRLGPGGEGDVTEEEPDGPPANSP